MVTALSINRHVGRFNEAKIWPIVINNQYIGYSHTYVHNMLRLHVDSYIAP
jgi:hypothetical protein